MTACIKPTTRPEEKYTFDGFDHVTFWVSNAKQVAAYYTGRYGFEYCAYRGLETGSRDVASWVVKQNKCVFVFSSPLNPVDSEISRRIMLKGDAVKDLAFRVKDCQAIFDKAVGRGAIPLQAPKKETDEFGTVITATIRTYGDVVHTFVQRDGYSGAFLPGYKAVDMKDPLGSLLPSPNLLYVDHVVGNQPDAQMTDIANWYEKTLDFHRFWTVDDKQIHTEYSSLRSIVMTDFDETIKMPINEPAVGKKKSQIQEFVEYHGGAGVQHIALATDNIIDTLTNLRNRGVDFLTVPDAYYEDVKRRLVKSSVTIKEDLDELKKLHILIDFDDKGYLLQIFTKPVEDRPTLFYEFIQRNNHTGFGAGNFKALFESIERDQARRGNL